jgi:alkylhydroperoxidase/carboxymuconolactone decarboxylase family protein YurZ
MADTADETPVLDTLTEMTAASLEHCDLDPASLMLVRIAALVAAGAPPASYLLNAPAAGEAGITVDQVQDVLAAVAPIVGAPRVMAAVGNIARAYGFAIAASESELDLA